MILPGCRAVRMTAAHLRSTAELERLVFSEPWSEKSLELLVSQAAVGFAVTDGDRVIAYGGMLYACDEGQITNIAVHPDHRRAGLGSCILQALLDHAAQKQLEQISLEVRVSNEAARAMYLRAGFTEEGVRRRFYRNPVEDALVMLKKIAE